MRLLRSREVLDLSADRLECIPDNADVLQPPRDEVAQPCKVVRHWLSVGCDLRRYALDVQWM